MGNDIRVPMDAFLQAFGLPATVTRPAPDETPIETEGFWVSPLVESQPFGTDFRRRDPRNVFVVSKAAVPHANKGTIVRVAEYEGGAIRTWMVDGYDQTEVDSLRLILVKTRG